MRNIFIILFFISFFSAFSIADADTGGISIIPNTNNITPNTSVVLELKSYSVDLDRANITWYKDGVKIVSGTGLKKQTVTSPSYGENDVYNVLVSTGAEVFEVFYTIYLSDIDLLVESDNGYDMPFYKGRPLPVKEGVVKVSAIPHIIENGKYLSTKNIIYNWSQNNTSQANYSGYGKRFYLYKNSYFYDSDKISVSAQNQSGGVKANKDIGISLYKPKILFYEKHPSQGVIFEKNVGDGVNLPNNTDFTVIAYPLYFSSKDALGPDLKYSWKINGSSLSTPSIKNQLTIRTNPESGSSRVELEIDPISKLYQKEVKSFYVSY